MSTQKNFLLRTLLVLNLAAFALLGFRQFNLNLRSREAREKRIQKSSAIDERNGIVRHDEALKINRLSDHIGHGGESSDAEIVWLLQLLRDGGSTPQKASMRRVFVVNILRDAIQLNHLTLSQKERISQALMDRIKLEAVHKYSESDITVVALALAELKDIRALPLLRLFLHDPRPAVRPTVKAAYQSLEAVEKASKKA